MFFNACFRCYRYVCIHEVRLVFLCLWLYIDMDIYLYMSVLFFLLYLLRDYVYDTKQPEADKMA